MKAAKVAIAAVVVAAMFLAVPFTSVASDAAWANDNEKAVYFEADFDKLTWEKYLNITGKTNDEAAKDIMKIMGYDNRDSYTFSDMKFNITEWYMGEASSLADKEVTYVKIAVQTIEFEFTAKAGSAGNMFLDTMSPYISDINDYLGVDGKVAKDDTITISGSCTMSQIAKNDDNYKNFDDNFAGNYSAVGSTANSISIDTSVKFVRGASEKEYAHTFSLLATTLSSTVYDIGDAEALTTDLYTYAKLSTDIENASLNFNFDNKDHSYDPVVKDVSNIDSGSSTITKVKNSEIVNKDVAFKNLVGETPLSEEGVTAVLKTVGTVTDRYSDVSNAYDKFVAPEEEASVNQGLFFGAFAVILIIAFVVALYFRERKTE